MIKIIKEREILCYEYNCKKCFSDLECQMSDFDNHGYANCPKCNSTFLFRWTAVKIKDD